MSRRIFWGSALLLVGFLLLASNLGIIGTFSVWGLWPIIFIWPALKLVCGLHFVTIGDWSWRRNIRMGPSLASRLVAFWILAGAMAELIHNVGLWTYTWGDMAYWTLPFLLVGLGLAVLTRRGGTWHWVSHGRDFGESNGNVSSLVGEIQYGRKPWSFKSPMRVDVWAGSIDLDLTTAKFEPGMNYLYVSAWAADIDVRAPYGIDVVAEASAAAGDLGVFSSHKGGIGVGLKATRRANRSEAEMDFEAETAKTVEDGPAAAGKTAEDKTSRLVIVVNVTFGDVKIW